MSNQKRNNKSKNREIERQKKQRRLVTRLVFVLALALVIFALTWVIWDNQNRRWIMTFEGERIAVTDYEFFLTQSGMPQAAMNDLQVHLAIMNRAERHNVAPTQNELDQATQASFDERMWMAREFGQDMFHFISDERIGEFQAALHFSVERLMEIYVPTYHPQGVEFEAELAEYIEENRMFYGQTDIIVITFEDAEVLEEMRELVIAGEETFETLIRERDEIPYLEEQGIARMSLSDFMWLGLEDEDLDAMLALQQGEVSPVIEFFDGFHFIAYMEIRVEATDAEIIESFTENYALEQRFIVFVDIVNGWVDEANVNINQRVFSA